MEIKSPEDAYNCGKEIFDSLPMSFFTMKDAQECMRKIKTDLEFNSANDLYIDLARLGAYADVWGGYKIRAQAEIAKVIANARPRFKATFLAGLKGEEFPEPKIIGAKRVVDPLARGKKPAKW